MKDEGMISIIIVSVKEHYQRVYQVGYMIHNIRIRLVKYSAFRL